MPIHTVGDSHALNAWRFIPWIHMHHIGPKLCFSIGRDGINIKDGFFIKNGDTVIFCFGEIDCRCHIHKYITETTHYKQVIDTIVENYFIKIKAVVDQFDTLKTAIYNVVPPIQRYNTQENKEYPYLGTDEERKAYVLYFNQKLQEKCLEYNFLFFNVYNNYIDENGYLSKKLSDNNVHINDPIHLLEFIKTNDLQ